MAEEPILTLDATTPVLVVGFGLHGQAVRAALATRGVPNVVVDDRPSAATHQAAAVGGVDLVVAPDTATLAALVDGVAVVVPTPGLAHKHEVFDLARASNRPVLGEFDLARMWDERPIVAITGTNGKTTVTSMVTEMLVASGRRAVAAGNLDVALVSAIDDPETEVFVVEASSFRLGHAQCFRPAVATWLNFAPDHLDVHRDLDAYERAKAAIWRDQRGEDVAIANAEDPVVMRNLGILRDRGRRDDVVTFGVTEGDNRVIDTALCVDGAPLIEIGDLFRDLPHDVSNALAAASTALAAGGSREAVASTLRTFQGLAHRVQLVAEGGGVRWYDDSKATSPHAVIAGVSGFASTILIAGGRNKGIDLRPLAQLAPRLRAVVAIGDAADEVTEVFAAGPVVVQATSMGAAVGHAAGLAHPGDVVVLSPGCTSFDWYANYGERGDDFARLVRILVEGERR